ncbi:gluconolaconase [Candidatus Methylopumilus universalis]|jgi:sugar lactone lactonase YvrE|uniref:SMP-30/gluconolactonase/LRE family protein n=1 Tax=Candidatus Methylopumilus universalis TaxID=2588536 RepID=UPI0011225598|nr:gluconolaconase [Candidatus Methylopumilus universalis]QDC45825.1 gluconolaconase [Candidatus Methylopumilus universalis]QDC98736.1 gluconolaconase [Candidatus Methylopumilus universalis]
MKNLRVFLILLLTLIATPSKAHESLNLISGFISPESVVQDAKGDIYVSEIGEFNKDGDGKITRISIDGKLSTFASGMDDPKGLTFIGKSLYVTDKNRVLKVESNGKWMVFGSTMAFPQTPIFLNDITSDEAGNLYVSDSGNLSAGGAIFKITQDKKITLILNENTPEILAPNGLLVVKNDLFEVDFASGILYKINLKTKSILKVAEGFGGGDGLIKSGDSFFVSDWKNGKIFKLQRNKVTLFKEGFTAAADIALSYDKRSIITPDMKTGSVTLVPIH